MARCFRRVWCAALLAVVVVLSAHTAHVVRADTKTCTTDYFSGSRATTGCYTAGQQANTLTVLRAFSDAIPHLQEIWTGDDFCAWSQYIECRTDGVEVTLSFTRSTVTGSMPVIPDSVDASQVMLTLLTVTSPTSTITGTLPPNLHRLSRLRALNVFSRGITGTLPDWTSLPALGSVQIRSTSITGTLPSAWSQLRTLRTIDVSQSRVSGTLPASWSSLSDLRVIQINNNLLTGPLPESWSTMTMLQNVNMRGNNFCGCVPYSWTNSSPVMRNRRFVDHRNTAAGGCATTNACLTTTSTTTTSVSPTATTTTTMTTGGPTTGTTTESPTITESSVLPSTDVPCDVPHCNICAVGNPNACMSCVPGRVLSSDGYCIPTGWCLVSGCAQCAAYCKWRCQSCLAGYSMTATGGCVRRTNGVVTGTPYTAAAAVVLASLVLLSQ